MVPSLTITFSRSPLRHFSDFRVISHQSCVMHHPFIFADEIIQWSYCSLTTSLIVIAVRKVEEDTAHGAEIQYNFIKMFTEPPVSPSPLQDRVADLLWKLIVYISAYGLDILMMIMLSKSLWCAKREAKRICASEGINHALMPCRCLLRIYQALYG